MTYNQIREKIDEGEERIDSINKENSKLNTLRADFEGVKKEAHLGTWFKTNSNGYVRIDDFTIETIIHKDGTTKEHKVDKVHGIGFKAVEARAVTNISGWFTLSELTSIDSAQDLYNVLNTIYYINNVYSD